LQFRLLIFRNILDWNLVWVDQFLFLRWLLLFWLSSILNNLFFSLIVDLSLHQLRNQLLVGLLLLSYLRRWLLKCPMVFLLLLSSNQEWWVSHTTRVKTYILVWSNWTYHCICRINEVVFKDFPHFTFLVLNCGWCDTTINFFIFKWIVSITLDSMVLGSILYWQLLCRYQCLLHCYQFVIWLFDNSTWCKNLAIGCNLFRTPTRTRFNLF
jgi:hypothetical protein